MFRKIWSLIIAALLLAVSAAAESETGLFGRLSAEEGADERLAILEEVAEPASASSEDDSGIEISQAYYEGNRVYISYTADSPVAIQDGLDLESGAYADIIAGEEIEQEDGSVIGWKECIVPDEEMEDTQTFQLAFWPSQESAEKSRISFTLRRQESTLYLMGTLASESCQATAEITVGRVDIRGTVRLTSPEQAASWIAWQEGEESTGTDVIACWNLYQNGEPVSYDLYGASMVDGTDDVVFEVMFPLLDDVSGLSLVPEYSEAGENPDEAIILEPVARN